MPPIPAPSKRKKSHFSPACLSSHLAIGSCITVFITEYMAPAVPTKAKVAPAMWVVAYTAMMGTYRVAPTFKTKRKAKSSLIEMLTPFRDRMFFIRVV